MNQPRRVLPSNMKRLFLVIMVCISTMGASAQFSNLLGNMFNKLTSKSTSTTTVTDDKKSTAVDAIKNVLGNLIGNSMPVSEATLTGVWNYEGTSCVLESDQALANIGGSAVTGTIEDKLDTYLSKVGVAPGACTFAFLENDSCQFTVKGRTINGTYKLNSEDKTVALNFYGRLSMTGHVSYDLSNLNLVFDADKLLELIKRVTSVVSSSNSDSGVATLLGGTQSSSAGVLTTLKAASSMLNNYNGMMLGLKLSK